MDEEMDGCEQVGSKDYNTNTFTISGLPYGRNKRHTLKYKGLEKPIQYSTLLLKYVIYTVWAVWPNTWF